MNDGQFKLIIGIVMGFVALILLIIVGAIFFTIHNNENQPSSAPAPSPTITVTATPTESETSASPSPSGNSSVNITGDDTMLNTLLEKTWTQASTRDKKSICLGWNIAPTHHDQFLHSFEKGLGPSTYNLIDMPPSEFENQLSDFFDEKCY